MYVRRHGDSLCAISEGGLVTSFGQDTQLKVDYWELLKNRGNLFLNKQVEGYVEEGINGNIKVGVALVEWVNGKFFAKN